jgi:GH15 family glucan-1,4-alpha-glucosidase
MEKLVAMQSRDGYLPIEDHGLIGDGSTAALVGRDGGVKWLCIPRFDSQPAFAALLDSHLGGEFAIRPSRLRASCQRYVNDTGVLVTEMQSEAGRVRVTDALTLRHGADIAEDVTAARGELLRVVEGVSGNVDVDINIEFFGGARATGSRHDFEFRSNKLPHVRLSAHSTIPLNGTRERVVLRPGQRWAVLLSWDQGSHRHRTVAPEKLLDQTIDAWKTSSRRIVYDGPQRDMVRRSAVTLKLLDHFRNGAIVAARPERREQSLDVRLEPFSRRHRGPQRSPGRPRRTSSSQVHPVRARSRARRGAALLCRPIRVRSPG